MATAKGSTTAARMREASEALLKAWNDRDATAIVDHLTDDVTWIDPTLEEPVRGKEAVTAHLKDTFEAFPDMHLLEDDYTLFTNTEEAATVSTWTFKGTMTGPSKEAGIPATGKQVTISGTTINRFSNGLVSEYAIVYDGLDFMQQLGALPRAEGIGFKALVMTDILAGKAVGQAGALVDRARHVLKR